MMFCYISSHVVRMASFPQTFKVPGSRPLRGSDCAALPWPCFPVDNAHNSGTEMILEMIRHAYPK